MGSGVSLGRRASPPRASEAKGQAPSRATGATAASAADPDSPRSGVSDLHEAMDSPAHSSPSFLSGALPRRLSLGSHNSNMQSLESSPARDSPGRPSSSPSRSDAEQHSVAELFAQTAMSLGMDNDDLIFNMMFFDDGSGSTFGNIMNTVQQETLALHSENNTPYKLNPASASAISTLIEEKYPTGRSEDEDCKDCAICREEFEISTSLLRIPMCRHFFHDTCLLKWSSLQSWCPVCRTALLLSSPTPLPAHVEGVGNEDAEKEAEESERDQEEEHQIHPQARASILALTSGEDPL